MPPRLGDEGQAGGLQSLHLATRPGQDTRYEAAISNPLSAAGGGTTGSFCLSVRPRRIDIFVGLLVVVASALVLPAVQVCRDWAFVDRNTGSRKGYRDWFLGWRTRSWYQKSGIEAFMRSNYPAEFRQNWVSSEGTGRNIFGGATLVGHGRPGPIVLLKPEVIADYCRSASAMEKRRLYDVFASGDEERIRELADHISKAEMTSEKTEPDGAANRKLPVRARTN